MSLLGDFLESFYSNRGVPQTIWARARRERIKTLSGDTSRRSPIGREKRPATEAKSITDYEFWARMPDHVREDQTRTQNGEPESTVEVAKAGQRLKRVADGSVEIEKDSRRVRTGADALPTDFRRHFDRTQIRLLFASLTLENLGECQVAARNCVRIRATPMPGDRIWPHWLPTEADEFEFAADLEYPTLLSIHAKLAGQVFETIEVTQVTFDGQIDDAIFDVQPLAGKQTRDAVPIVQNMTLQAASEKLAFKIVVPKMDPEFGEPGVHFHPPRGKSPEHLTIHYIGASVYRFWFSLSASFDTEEHKRLEWEDVEFAGRRFRLSDPNVEGGKSVLVFKLEGTWVEIVSDFPRNKLLEVAGSFEVYKA